MDLEQSFIKNIEEESEEGAVADDVLDELDDGGAVSEDEELVKDIEPLEENSKDISALLDDGDEEEEVDDYDSFDDEDEM